MSLRAKDMVAQDISVARIEQSPPKWRKERPLAIVGAKCDAVSNNLQWVPVSQIGCFRSFYIIRAEVLVQKGAITNDEAKDKHSWNRHYSVLFNRKLITCTDGWHIQCRLCYCKTLQTILGTAHGVFNRHQQIAIWLSLMTARFLSLLVVFLTMLELLSIPNIV